ncbi:MAG: alanine--tRNA ligase [Alphaproteobacteria bacterium]|nr:alanine--tRNA ligase [Alphaproteobacteria bacterium]
MTAVSEIRSTFLDYFAKHDHAIVESSPLVPRNDPTLMFTNAGMVQFKNVFTGAEKRDYTRAATTQKCVRAGGKHNDLDNVGYTARHHTFFEMLGNFSFGDYFKDLAIELAWGLSTKEFGLPKDRLYVTVYHDDDEAFDLWRKIAGLPESRIIRIATSDNFWMMGDTGPCGPCSEIFYDRGDHIWGGPPGSPEEDGDRFLEFWNLVFMQYEQMGPGDRVSLPRPSIDTGMGLERIAALLQGRDNNFDIDLFQALIIAIAEATHTTPNGEGQVTSQRVIADHLRSTAFLIADGVLPSNEGRGYVLRRIMRRAMRHAHMLGAEEPVMWKLVPALIREMGHAFPELGRARSLITETLKLEETRFKKTLERGLRLLEAETEMLAEEGELSGDVAFKLYDTYGFPKDLTADILRGQGRSLDEDGFEAAMEKQKAAARAAWSGSGEAATEAVWFELRDKVGATDFLGYDTEAAEGQILAIVKDGAPVDRAAAGDSVALILNQTPFYGESGGQMGDEGMIRSADGAVVSVTDTQKKLGDLFVHMGTVAEGELKLGDEAALTVDSARRAKLRANHSATHLLHEALRRHLGDHVTQKGSLVAPGRLRFDISHPRPVETDDIRVVETEVNARVRLNAPVETRLMTPDEAVEAGALALFGEKYGEEVRVVSMGGDDPEKAGFGQYSTELCGGTHVRRTGDIGFFKIVGEGAVSAGIRRIEAVTGEGAYAYVADRDSLLEQAAGELKTRPQDLPHRLGQLLEERKKLERELTEMRKKLAAGGGGGAGPEIKEVGGLKVAGRVVEGVPAKELKGLADGLKGQLGGDGVVVVIGKDEGKASIVVAVTDGATAKASAVDLVRVGSAALGGKGGGGRPDMAQAGGPDPDKAADAIAAIESELAKLAEGVA